jgi:hypothetical protein
MIEAWERIVLDDAPPEQKLGAMTLSELRASQIKALHETIPGLVAEALGDELSVEQLESAVAMAIRQFSESIDLNLERLKLRLEGRWSGQCFPLPRSWTRLSVHRLVVHDSIIGPGARVRACLHGRLQAGKCEGP